MNRMSRVREVVARRDGVAQLAVVLGAFALYEAARYAMEPNWAQAFANAKRVLRAEQVLGLAWEQSLQRAFLALPDLVHALNIFYFVGHFVITGVFFLWLYHRSRDGFRSFRDGFLIATAISVVVHWLFPTAPPRLAGVGLEDTLLLFSGIDIGSPASLVRRHCPERTVVVTTAHPSAEASFAALPGVQVERRDLNIAIRGRGDDLVTSVIHRIATEGIPVRDFRTETPTLEDVFLTLTGESIRT